MDKPAFPLNNGNYDQHGFCISPPDNGLTRRELFAAMAMPAIIRLSDYDPPDSPANVDVVAKAVRYADALIAELDREPTP